MAGGLKFEEVNLRTSCCSFLQETGSIPQYCSQFTPYIPGGKFELFCSTLPLSTRESSFSQRELILQSPYEYSFAKNSDGKWFLTDISKKNKGKYASYKVYGGKTGSLLLSYTTANETISLNFDDFTYAEFPIENNKMGSYLKLPRKTLSIIVDHSKGIP